MLKLLTLDEYLLGRVAIADEISTSVTHHT